MSVERRDANFGDCAAWLYGPAGPGPHPCVVMAHGFSLTRHDALPQYAEAFAEAGFATLVFDYRHLGDSGGDAGRFRVSEQRRDWRDAIAHARALPNVDAERIVLWGYSFGGGHVVEAAAADSRIAAVLALMPFLDGLPRVLKNPLGQTTWIVPRAIADRLGRRVRVPATAPPHEHGAMALPGEFDGFRQSVGPGSSWRNEIGPGLFLTVAFFRPVANASKLRMPVWFGLGERDISVSPSAIRKAAARAQNAELTTYPTYDHFGGLHGDGPALVAADQLAFLRKVGLG